MPGTYSNLHTSNSFLLDDRLILLIWSITIHPNQMTSNRQYCKFATLNGLLMQTCIYTHHTHQTSHRQPTHHMHILHITHQTSHRQPTHHIYYTSHTRHHTDNPHTTHTTHHTDSTHTRTLTHTTHTAHAPHTINSTTHTEHELTQNNHTWTE